jgi:hypothetical protein
MRSALWRSCLRALAFSLCLSDEGFCLPLILVDNLNGVELRKRPVGSYSLKLPRCQPHGSHEGRACRFDHAKKDAFKLHGWAQSIGYPDKE